MFCRKSNFMKVLLIAVSIGTSSSCKIASQNASELYDDEDSPEIQRYKKFKPHTCESSKATQFKNSRAEITKPITVKTEIQNVFGTQGAQATYGVIYDPSATEDLKKFIPVAFESRGNSRAIICEVKPARIYFLLQPTAAQDMQKLDSRPYDWRKVGLSFEGHKKIIDDMNNAGIQGEPQRLQFYYDAFKATQAGQDRPRDGFPQEKTTFFGQMGDDVKLVTHCGKTSRAEWGGRDYVEQRAHLLNEFFIYRLLNEWKTTTIKTSVLEITYVDANTLVPKVFEGRNSAPAFLRESRSKLASRCGLLPEKTPTTARDEVSYLQADFLNRLFISLDFSTEGHNSEFMFNDQGVKFVTTYDFDLSGLWTETYAKNPGTVEQNAEKFRNFLNGKNGDEKYLSQVLYFLSKMKKISKKVEEIEHFIDPNSPPEQKKFVRWLKAFEPVLRGFVENNRATNGPFIEAVERFHSRTQNEAADPEG